MSVSYVEALHGGGVRTRARWRGKGREGAEGKKHIKSYITKLYKFYIKFLYLFERERERLEWSLTTRAHNAVLKVRARPLEEQSLLVVLVSENALVPRDEVGGVRAWVGRWTGDRWMGSTV